MAFLHKYYVSAHINPTHFHYRKSKTVKTKTNKNDYVAISTYALRR